MVKCKNGRWSIYFYRIEYKINTTTDDYRDFGSFFYSLSAWITETEYIIIKYLLKMACVCFGIKNPALWCFVCRKVNFQCISIERCTNVCGFRCWLSMMNERWILFRWRAICGLLMHGQFLQIEERSVPGARTVLISLHILIWYYNICLATKNKFEYSQSRDVSRDFFILLVFSLLFPLCEAFTEPC